MDSDSVPSTSKRSKYLKYASDKLNARNQYPVAFDEFRKFTNVEEYVVSEMERSGPEICRINYCIRHEYYPIVYKKFYESKSARDKMMLRGLTIKPIPKFLKEKLLQMPASIAGEDTSSSHKTKHDMNVRFASTKDGKSPATAIYKSSSGKSRRAPTSSANQDTSLRHTPKTKGKSKPRVSLGKDVSDSPADSQKITNFFSALKLVKSLENIRGSKNEQEKTRKRKPEIRETSPTVKRLKDAGSKGSPPADKVPLAVVNRVPMGPKSKRKTINGRLGGRGKHKNNENRRTVPPSSAEILMSDDSDIHSNADVKETQKRRSASLKSSPVALEKSPPLPKRNRTEAFQKPSPTPDKSPPKKDSEQILSSSDTEMALLSLSGAVKKTLVQVSCEIQDWLSKGNPSEGDSADESVPSFLEDGFTAVDKLRAIQKYPGDVRNYVRYLLNAEIQRRRIAYTCPEEKHGSVSKSRVVAAFREMTFDEYKVLMNADKLYAQGPSEKITSDLRAQHEAIISGKRPWPRDQHVKLSTLSDYLRSKGLTDRLELKCIPPRLLSFEETLEHTNLKEWTSLSRSEPPASYKQLLSLCRSAYLKCCAEGVWLDGVHFIDSNDQQEELSEDINLTLATEGGATEPADQSTSSSSKNGTRSDEQRDPPGVQDRLSGDVWVEETQENPPNNAESSSATNHMDDDCEKMMEQLFAELEVPQLKETPAAAVAEQQANVSLEAPPSERLPDSQPLLEAPPSEGFPGSQPLLEAPPSEGLLGSQPVLEAPPSEGLPGSQPVLETSPSEGLLGSQPVLEAPPSEGLPGSQPVLEAPSSEGLPGSQPLLEAPPFEGLPGSQPVLEAPPSEGLPGSQPVLGFIPPSPALFQSSGESDQRTQIVESQQVVARPPEAVFIPCDRSMTFNTEENNMTVMSVDHDNHDPFATQNPEDRLDDSPVHATIERASPVLDAVVKKEPQSANNTQNSYNPFDDSVQILDIPPSEPITIDDEESAPELLNLLLMRPLPNDSTFVPPNSQPTQTSACMETFVHAQRMASDLSSMQSQLISSQLNQDSPKDTGIAVELGGADKASDALSTAARVKEEKEINMEAEAEHFDTDLIKSSIKTYSEEQSLSRRGSPQSPVSVNTSRENADLSAEHSYSTQARGVKQVTMIESICVFIPPQRISSELESTLNAVSTISVQDSTWEKSKADVVADGQEDPTAAVEAEVADEGGESVIEAVVEPMSDEEMSTNEVASQNVTPQDETTVPSASLNECETERRENTHLDPPIESDVNLADAVQEQQPASEEKQEDAPLSATQASVHSSGSDVVAKSEATRKDLNDNLSAEPLTLPGFPDVDISQYVGAPSHVPELALQLELVQSLAYICEISGDTLDHNDLFVGCNLEVNTNMSQAEMPALGCEIEVMQVDEEDNRRESDVQSGSLLAADAKDGADAEANREAVPSEEQAATPAIPAAECGEESNEVVQKGEQEMSSEEAETNLCSNVAVEPDSYLPDIAAIAEASQQVSLPNPSPDNQAECASNSERNTADARVPAANLKKAFELVLSTDPPKPNKKRTFALPVLLPIAAFKSDKIDEFVENPERFDEPELGDNSDDLVEVPILIHRRFLKMLPFDIGTQQQTTNESIICGLNSKLEFSLQELRLSENAADVASKNEAGATLKQKKATEDDATRGSGGTMPRVRVANLKKGTRTAMKSKTPAENEMTRETLQTLRKPTQSTSNRKKKMSPRKVAARRPSALDFVPQKTHAFRSLTLGVAKKAPAKPQTTEVAPSHTEESNYNIEDVSQAIASSTASQMLGTDCTYFESSQLLRNIEHCDQPAAIQVPAEAEQKATVQPKVNTFDRISLSEGLTARRIWQVNLAWRARQKMSMEVRFFFENRTLTACNSSAHSLFNFSPTTWCDILRVLREIDHFEYKRTSAKNYQAPTPLHRVLRSLFESVPQVVNVKLTIDTHNPYASCEKVTRLSRKPFQCLTKAIPPSILSRMKAIKDSLREDMSSDE